MKKPPENMHFQFSAQEGLEQLLFDILNARVGPRYLYDLERKAVILLRNIGPGKFITAHQLQCALDCSPRVALAVVRDLTELFGLPIWQRHSSPVGYCLFKRDGKTKVA
jgi:hypothetical protein